MLKGKKFDASALEKILSQTVHQPKDARTTAVMQAHIR